MVMDVTLLLLWVFLGAVSVVSPLTCSFCDRTDCGAPLKCKGSVGYDVCGCCPQCAKLEGQKCGGDWGELGFCDTGLRCVLGICSSGEFYPCIIFFHDRVSCRKPSKISNLCIGFGRVLEFTTEMTYATGQKSKGSVLS